MVPFPGADHAAEQGQKDADAARNGRNECARDNEEFHAKKDYAQNEQGRRLIAGQIPGNVVAEEEQGKRGNGHNAADAESRRFKFHVNAADAQQDQDGGSPCNPEADALKGRRFRRDHGGIYFLLGQQVRDGGGCALGQQGPAVFQTRGGFLARQGQERAFFQFDGAELLFLVGRDHHGFHHFRAVPLFRHDRASKGPEGAFRFLAHDGIHFLSG